MRREFAELHEPGAGHPLRPVPAVPPAHSEPAERQWGAYDSTAHDSTAHDLVFHRLLERRIVLLSGRLDDETVNRAAAQLMLLDADGDEPIELHLASLDGELEPANLLAETLDLVGVPVRAHCRGTITGPGLAPLAAATTRLASPNALFVLQEPSVQLEGRADQIALAVQQHQRQLQQLRDRLAAATGRTSEQVGRDLDAHRTLTAPEAVDYGLLDEIRGARG